MSSELLGTVTLITRAKEQAQDLQDLVASYGGSTLVQPGIEILPPNDYADLDDELFRLARGEYEWAIFSSANGVKYALERANALNVVAFDNVKIAAVGSGTRDALAGSGLQCDLVPAKFDADGIVDALVALHADDIARQRFVSFRANRGRKTLRDRLTALGAEIREVETYRSVDATTPLPEVVSALEAGKIDYATVMSSATAKALVNLLGENVKKTRWVALSALTADAMRKEGVEVDAIAEEATIESLVETVAALHKRLQNDK